MSLAEPGGTGDKEEGREGDEGGGAGRAVKWSLRLRLQHGVSHGGRDVEWVWV